MGEDVKGTCPACGWKSLFLGSGGYVTCRQFDCPNPSAASDLLEKAGASFVWARNCKFNEATITAIEDRIFGEVISS